MNSPPVDGLILDRLWLEGDLDFTSSPDARKARSLAAAERRPSAVAALRLAFHTVFGVASAEPYGATRWRFER